MLDGQKRGGPYFFLHTSKNGWGQLLSLRPAEREDREIGPGDDVRVVARPPQLDERRVLPRRRLDALDARVKGEHGRPRHAVLQAGPGRLTERLRARRQALVEPVDPPPERDDLLPCQLEARRHARKPNGPALYARPR